MQAAQRDRIYFFFFSGLPDHVEASREAQLVGAAGHHFEVRQNGQC